MSTTIVYPNATEFDQLIAGDKPVLVDFWAEWCMPCRMLGPVIEQIGEEYSDKVAVAKVNVDEQPALAARYNIQSGPTVIIFNNGSIVDTQIGMHPADVYTRILDTII